MTFPNRKAKDPISSQKLTSPRPAPRPAHLIKSVSRLSTPTAHASSKKPVRISQQNSNKSENSSPACGCRTKKSVLSSSGRQSLSARTPLAVLSTHSPNLQTPGKSPAQKLAHSPSDRRIISSPAAKVQSTLDSRLDTVDVTLPYSDFIVSKPSESIVSYLAPDDPFASPMLSSTCQPLVGSTIDKLVDQNAIAYLAKIGSPTAVKEDIPTTPMKSPRVIVGIPSSMSANRRRQSSPLDRHSPSRSITRSVDAKRRQSEPFSCHENLRRDNQPLGSPHLMHSPTKDNRKLCPILNVYNPYGFRITEDSWGAARDGVIINSCAHDTPLKLKRKRSSLVRDDEQERPKRAR